MAVIHKIREKMRNNEFEFAIPHFFEEMADDGLTMSDVENAIGNGRIRRKFTRDYRGTRYEIVVPTRNMRDIAVICRIKTTGKLLLITVYAL